MKHVIVDIKKKKVGEVDLAQGIFAKKPNHALLYEAVKMELTNRRLGTAATKNTALVSGSTRKIYRQKGTGNARHGSIKRHIFVGGGVAFGPMPRDYSYAIPRKARRSALSAALALKYTEEKMIVVDHVELPKIKTQQVVQILQDLGVDTALIVTEKFDVHLSKSARNIPGVSVVGDERVSIAELLRHNYLIITAKALKRLEARLGGQERVLE